MDRGLSERQTAVCEAIEVCVCMPGVQYRGSPGSVLSPLLYTLYISDFRCISESCHLQKFSDDTAIVGCVEDGQEGEYRGLVDHFVKWYWENHPQLNMAKTKKTVVDFRRKVLSKPTPFCNAH